MPYHVCAIEDQHMHGEGCRTLQVCCSFSHTHHGRSVPRKFSYRPLRTKHGGSTLFEQSLAREKCIWTTAVVAHRTLNSTQPAKASRYNRDWSELATATEHWCCEFPVLLLNPRACPRWSRAHNQQFSQSRGQIARQATAAVFGTPSRP